MGGFPTHASVTEMPCRCNYLQHAADEPSIPIVFDGRTNEYHFVYQEPDSIGPSILIIYHCPFCGGAAPASHRHFLFRVISREEEGRLAELLAPVHTIRDALEKLGEPDHDDPHGRVTRHAEPRNRPSSVALSRTLVYKSLSDIADVHVTERQDGTVYCTLQGKYIGNASADAST